VQASNAHGAFFKHVVGFTLSLSEENESAVCSLTRVALVIHIFVEDFKEN
jgi:hypothetical protein